MNHYISPLEMVDMLSAWTDPHRPTPGRSGFPFRRIWRHSVTGGLRGCKNLEKPVGLQWFTAKAREDECMWMPIFFILYLRLKRNPTNATNPHLGHLKNTGMRLAPPSKVAVGSPGSDLAVVLDPWRDELGTHSSSGKCLGWVYF